MDDNYDKFVREAVIFQLDYIDRIINAADKYGVDRNKAVNNVFSKDYYTVQLYDYSGWDKDANNYGIKDRYK